MYLHVPWRGGGGGSAMIADGGGVFILFREEPKGEIIGEMIGTCIPKKYGINKAFQVHK